MRTPHQRLAAFVIPLLLLLTSAPAFGKDAPAKKSESTAPATTATPTPTPPPDLPVEKLIPPGQTFEKTELDWVGFQQFEEVSRVFVRTVKPVEYKVDTSRPNTVTLILENTRIRRTINARIHPTSHFVSPFLKFIPRILEGPTPSTHIEIHLRHQASFKKVQKNQYVALDFQR